MALIPRVVQNTSNNPIDIPDVITSKGAPLRLPPGTVVDLSLTTLDTDIARSFHLNHQIEIESVKVVATSSQGSIGPAKKKLPKNVNEWIQAQDSQVGIGFLTDGGNLDSNQADFPVPTHNTVFSLVGAFQDQRGVCDPMLDNKASFTIGFLPIDTNTGLPIDITKLVVNGVTASANMPGGDNNFGPPYYKVTIPFDDSLCPINVNLKIPGVVQMTLASFTHPLYVYGVDSMTGVGGGPGTQFV